MLELVLRDVESKKEYGSTLLHNEKINPKTDGHFFSLFHNYQYVVDGTVKGLLVQGNAFITGTADKAKQAVRNAEFKAKIAEKKTLKA